MQQNYFYCIYLPALSSHLKKKEEDFTVTLYITFTDREEHRVAKASPSHPSRMRFEDLKSQKID